MLIENSIALVTGANRGIGYALVNELITAGAKKIYALTRNQTLPNFNAGTSKVVVLHGDIADAGDMESIAEQANDVNLLFNNAGVLDMGNILEISIEDIRKNFETNFYGTLQITRHIVPVIERNGGGEIVNTLTLLSLASMPGFAAYNAAKAAEWSMTQSLRASLANRNIVVRGVFPGAVDTDMLREIEMAKTSPHDVAHAIVQGVIENKEDIFPDPMSLQVYTAWKEDHKAIEKQFAQM